MKNFSLLMLLLFSLAAPVHGQEIYSGTDSSGRTIYSSKPKNNLDKPVALPPITKSPPVTLPSGGQSCRVHGGVDCRAGPDGDGSVICIDGYRDAPTRFAFSCTTPRLEISEIVESNKQGGSSIHIRNLSSVAAKGVKVVFKPDIGTKVTLLGPIDIEPYESGEYVYNPLDGFKNIDRLERGKVSLGCSNCP